LERVEEVVEALIFIVGLGLALIILLTFVVMFLLLFDVTAIAWGADSREQSRDDHQRRLPGGI
jgi:hypothetical protein